MPAACLGTQTHSKIYFKAPGWINFKSKVLLCLCQELEKQSQIPSLSKKESGGQEIRDYSFLFKEIILHLSI